MGGESVTTLPPWPLIFGRNIVDKSIMNLTLLQRGDKVSYWFICPINQMTSEHVNNNNLIQKVGLTGCVSLFHILLQFFFSKQKLTIFLLFFEEAKVYIMNNHWGKNTSSLLFKILYKHGENQLEKCSLTGNNCTTKQESYNL